MKSIKISRKKVIFLFCILYPILPVYAQIGSVNFRNLLCLCFGVLAFALTLDNIKLTVRYTGILWCFGFWILVRCIQIIGSEYYLETLYFLLRTVIAFICLQTLISQCNDFINALKAILVGAFIVAVFGIAEEITRVNPFSLLNIDYELNYNPLRFGLLRILGFSQHTIAHGIYIMFIMSLCTYTWQFCYKRFDKWLIGLLYCLLWINLVLTLSRSIIICTICSQLLILYLIGVRKLFKVLFKLLIIGLPILLISSMIIPQISTAIRYGFLMISALFNDKSATLISSAFGNDNLKGVGNRLDLYGWVYEKMSGYWLYGHGLYADFSYSFTQSNGVYTWTQTKDSIEVQYLNTLYQFGLWGMITEILSFISLLIFTLKKIRARKTWEKHISFNKIAFATFACYFMELFAVNQSSDKFIFYLFVMLTIIYNNRMIEK